MQTRNTHPQFHPILSCCKAMLAAALLLAAGQHATVQAANIGTNDVTATLWPGGAPFTFFDSASTGGGDFGAVTNANFDRSFGSLTVGTSGSQIVIRGLGWAAAGSSSFNATRVIATITYLGADGVIGGTDDVVIGKATNNVTASSAAGEWAWVFDAPLTNTIDGVNNNFRIQLAVGDGGTGNMKFKTTGTGTQPASAAKISVAGTSTAVGGATPAVQWAVGDGNWNITTSNWQPLGGGAATTYADAFDTVFNDSATGTSPITVTLATSVLPLSVTNDSTKNYIFTGGFGIGGATSLVKLGNSTLTLANDNTFAGLTEVQAGTLQVGNGGTTGSLGAGNVLNNASLVINRSDSNTVSGVISGSGTVTTSGTGVTTLNSANSYSGVTTINAGSTLRAGANGSLGTAAAGTTVQSGGTLEINGKSLGAEVVTASGSGVGGAGAIINNGAVQQSALRYVTLAGDTAIGGAARWDMYSTTSAPDAQLAGNGYKLTKVGANSIFLKGLGETDLGDIDIQEGALGFQSLNSTNTTLGQPAKTCTVFSGAKLSFWNMAAYPVSKVVSVQDGGSITAGGGGGGLDGTLTFSGVVTNYVDSGTDILTIGSAIGGSGTMDKTGPGTLVLTNVNFYTGTTRISAGTLQLASGASIANSPLIEVAAGATYAPAGLAIGAAQTLSGNGSVTGPLALDGTLSPGIAGTGTLTCDSAVTLNAGSALAMDINKTGVTLTSDQIAGAAGISGSGALNVTASGDALAGGDTFTLFNVPPTATFTPSLPALAAGLNWFTPDNYATLTVNGAPTGSDIELGVGLGETNIIVIIGGKHAPTDPDATDIPNLVVSGVGGSPTKGAASYTSTSVTYVSSGASSGADSFTYTVGDGRGGTVTQTVNVTVGAGGNGANITSLSGTVPNITIYFAGLPSSTYSIERATSPTGPWSQIAAGVSTGSNGQASYLDTSAPSPSGYYRTRYVSTP